MQPPIDQFNTISSLLTSATSSLLTLSPSPLSMALALTAADMIPTSTTGTIIAATSTAVSVATGSYKGPNGPDEDNGECKLLGPFALFVQAALGGLALLSLVWKRYRERPQRPVRIWAFDASKQVVGSVLLHLANLFMSMLSAGQFSVQKIPSVSPRLIGRENGEEFKPNPCSFYLLNLAIDTTIGIPILIFLLRLLTLAFRLTSFGSPPESIQSGYYGYPPRTSWWLKQSLIYFLGLLGMKLCVLFIFSVFPWISMFGDWALRWTEGDERIQVAFVMLLFPLIMNALQYYIIDTFIKGKPTTEDGGHAEAGDGEDSTTSDSERLRRRQRSGFDASEDVLLSNGSSDNTLLSDSEEDLDNAKDTKLPSARIRGANEGKKKGTRKPKKSGLREYDPAIDGDETVVGSAVTSNQTNLLPRE